MVRINRINDHAVLSSPVHFSRHDMRCDEIRDVNASHRTNDL